MADIYDDDPPQNPAIGWPCAKCGKTCYRTDAFPEMSRRYPCPSCGETSEMSEEDLERQIARNKNAGDLINIITGTTPPPKQFN